MAGSRSRWLLGATLPLTGIVLALADWNARPDRAPAWSAAIVVFGLVVIAQLLVRRALRRSSGDPASARSLATMTRALEFGPLLMVVPLAVILGQAYGLVTDPASGQRAVMIVVGLYFAALGNALPRELPPISVMQHYAARIQAFKRLTGWTWVLCGLGIAGAWLVLPIDAATLASVALVAVALVVPFAQLVRLRDVHLRRASHDDPRLG